MFYKSLAAVCVLRDKDWTPKPLPMSFHLLELIGEVGELANAVKKVERDKYGLPGSKVTKEDIADEIGDCVICVMNIANRVSSLPEPAAPRSIVVVAEEVFQLALLSTALIQTICPGTLNRLMSFLSNLAFHYKIDFEEAVVSKFNKTSKRYGFRSYTEYQDMHLASLRSKQ